MASGKNRVGAEPANSRKSRPDYPYLASCSDESESFFSRPRYEIDSLSIIFDCYNHLLIQSDCISDVNAQYESVQIERL